MTIEELYTLYVKYPIVTTDSRNIPQDSLFFALKGERFNGNLFAKEALEQGSRYAIVDETTPETQQDQRVIVVENVLITLQALARHHRRCLGLPVIGITGTNGKTTTKELIASVLSTQYTVLYTAGNLNNSIGVPLTLLRLNKTHEMAIIEMGASHPGDIKELAEIAEPDYGIITNVGLAHLQGFKSLEGVIQTKSELFDYLKTYSSKRIVFVDQDNTYLASLLEGLSPIFYGEQTSARIQGKFMACHPFLSFQWREKEMEFQTVNTQLIGSYNLKNALAAISVGRFFNVPITLIQKALCEYTPTNNRSQLTQTLHNQVIVDAYNANPTSMEAALHNFEKIEHPQKMVFLGAMKELGERSREEHLKISRQTEQLTHTKVVFIGQEFCDLQLNALTFATTQEAKEWLEVHPLKGYLLLLKGSNSMRLSQLIDVL